MALPDVTEQAHFHLTSFRVRGKIFVTAPPEGTHLHVFVDDALRGPDVVENLVRAAWEGKSRKRALAKSAKIAKKIK